ncbi:MAG: glycosyltransferase family 39 protein [Caulobacteraceae bacterium]|nr:glycosyltransferase family 39 protein [Caulobacter sp.]
MTDAPPPPAAAPAPWRLIVAWVAAATALRVAVLFLTPLELYPDEAQYWAWSRHLAFGYFSKPPMIAWLIAATTALGGDGEPWVRLSAPLLHGGAALLLAGAAGRLYDGRVAAWTAAIYTLMPGVQLSSGVIATDAPLLFFLSLALLAYAGWWRRPGLAAAAGFGAALGLACLSKYAGLYAVLGAAAHALVDRRAREGWRGGRLALAAAALLAVWSPNLVWNALHHFQTVAHTAADADWREPGEAALGRGDRGFDPRGPGGFVLGQFGVFGPVPFLALLAGVAWLVVRRRRPAGADRLLLCFTAPALLIVLGEAAAARANANWAAAAYPSGAVLAASWLCGGGAARRWRDAGLALQALAAALFMVAAMRPSLADAVGLGGAFKRASGWAQTTGEVRDYVSALKATGPVTAVAVDDRFLFNALTYYGRGGLGAPLRMWVHEAGPRNQAEAEHPLTPIDGGRVAFASLPWTRAAMRDFAQVSDVRQASARLDRRHVRAFTLFEGRGFRPVPRVPGRHDD